MRDDWGLFSLSDVEPHRILAAIVISVKALLTFMLLGTLHVQCAVVCMSQQHSHMHESAGQNTDNVVCQHSQSTGDSKPNDGAPLENHSESGCADSSCEVAASNQAAQVIPVIDHAGQMVESKLLISISKIVVANESEDFSPPPINIDTRLLSLRI